MRFRSRSTATGSGDCSLEFSPALSLRAQIGDAEMNGRRVPFQINKSDVDQHVTVRVPVGAAGTRCAFVSRMILD